VKFQQPVARDNTFAVCSKANEKLFFALLVLLIAARQNSMKEGLRKGFGGRGRIQARKGRDAWTEQGLDWRSEGWDGREEQRTPDDRGSTMLDAVEGTGARVAGAAYAARDLEASERCCSLQASSERRTLTGFKLNSSQRRSKEKIDSCPVASTHSSVSR